MCEHIFSGKWITNTEFFCLRPRNVFHRQLDNVTLSCDEHRNRHILFRKDFFCEDTLPAKIFISADDYYKLYINGKFVCQGPAPSYHFRYCYNEVDVSKYLQKGRNVIAVHTLYQGLINRVWQSGDNRHGLILDLEIGGSNVLKSDETFKTAIHSGYSELGLIGYETQFAECYSSKSPEVDFFMPDFDDKLWENAKFSEFDDHILYEQKSSMLVFEKIPPKNIQRSENRIIIDFGSEYVGYLNLSAKGIGKVIVRCGQELSEDGSVRFDMRCNCRYEEIWELSGGKDTLDWFDYKSFRYAELILPENCTIGEIYLNARHYPFSLRAKLREDYAQNAELKKIWDLCTHTIEYGVQEVIQDCMDREKGFYVGDGCYTALTHMLLTHDDSIVRKLIDDGFSSSFITGGLVTCLDCSKMQEIAEYPLMMIYLVLWHYNFTGDAEYLRKNFEKSVSVLESYRHDYEEAFLLRNLDKWCVVEWPKNFQCGYDVDISEGKICRDAHVAINAYYIHAVHTVNKMAEILALPPYRDESTLKSAFFDAFYDKRSHLFKDGENSAHKSLVGNIFPFGFGIIPDEEFKSGIIKRIFEDGIDSVSFFCTFPALIGLVKNGIDPKEVLLCKGAWLRMLEEGATTTFEGWGRDTKWNTSLFHLTLSYAAAFMTDTDLNKIF